MKDFTTQVATIIFLVFFSSNVSGHGYLKSPRSRNWIAAEDGKWSGGSENDPIKETCPHCLNRKDISGSCGKIDQGPNYDYPLNALGGPMPKNIQATYSEGGLVDLEAVLTAHHMGHFVYKACPIQEGEVASQECFDSHPLEFVEDNLYGATPDPNYPDRAYIPRTTYPWYQKTVSNTWNHSHKYRLPENLVGELVLIQWHYITANSCKPEGYDDYNFPPYFEPSSTVGTCNSLPEDGNGTPEQFWNCAEVKITASGPISPVAPPIKAPTPPVAPPTKAPTPPTASPVAAPTKTPISSPTIEPEESSCSSDNLGAYVATPDCTGFYYCREDGTTSAIQSCSPDLLYNEIGGYCDYADNVDC